jgi:hypothetical protein
MSSATLQDTRSIHRTTYISTLKIIHLARHWWLMPVILAVQEAEIRRMAVHSQLGQIVPQDPISKNPSQK